MTTRGGPVFIAVGEETAMNYTVLYDDQISPVGVKLNTTIGHEYFFTHSLVEYYFYVQPIVKKVEPLQGLASGGTFIEISGGWFDEKI